MKYLKNSFVLFLFIFQMANSGLGWRAKFYLLNTDYSEILECLKDPNENHSRHPYLHRPCGLHQTVLFFHFDESEFDYSSALGAFNRIQELLEQGGIFQTKWSSCRIILRMRTPMRMSGEKP